MSFNRTIFAVAALAAAVLQAGERRLSLDDFRDRMKGGWVGQMVGVSWGMPTEFKFNDVVIPADKVPAWSSDMPRNMAYNNDDLYVEMTFLRTLEQYGLDVSIRQAGIDFANSEYALWCANRAGRMNLRKGIAPPDSSHPKFNGCPNDIDYQIEADYAGLIAPGCPQEAIRLGNVFGRLMNFGDGVHAGQFVGALYAEAFFTSDVDRLLDAGLAAIPSESEYAQMVRNVRAWHKESPNDWTKCWERIRATYTKSGNPAMKDSNGGIDARLNGAAVVLGLVYGQGDLDKSMLLSMRCGWDSDCNPSTVGGVLMTARGFKALPAKYTEKLSYDVHFSYTAYNLPKLFAVCEKLARQIVVRHGGRIEKDAEGREWFVLPDAKPVPDAYCPSWRAPAPAGARYAKEEMKAVRHPLTLPDARSLEDPDPTVRVQKALDALWPGWKTSRNAPDMHPGYVDCVDSTGGELFGAVRTHPPKQGEAVTLSRRLKVPAGNPTLHFAVLNAPGGDFRLRVKVDGAAILSTRIGDYQGNWQGQHHAYDISLEPWTGREVTVELVNEPTGWVNEAAVWHDVRITANSGNL